jgi:hypothetical protein
MATTWATRLVSANTRVGVDSRKRANCEGMRARAGDNLSVDMITCLGYPTAQWGDMMTGMYRNQSNSAAAPTAFSKLRLYTDMADEPWKYGDDILGWTDLDEQLRSGSERADVEAYWSDREAREQAAVARKQERDQAELNSRRAYFRSVAKEAAKLAMKRWVERDIKAIVYRFKSSATKIQALVRGYQARCKDAHQDCCMCLSHRISPLKTNVGYMCRDCAVLGPYEDLVEEDPWNWHRAEYVDEAPNHHVYDTCSWCNQEFFAPLYYVDYCSGECEYYDRNA